jgi:hypothetical protein
MTRRRLDAARMALVQALTRSQAAGHRSDPDGRATQQHLFAAELKLRQAGCETLAGRVRVAADDDVSTARVREELRETAQKIDAAREPDVVALADGGGQR